MDRITPEWVRIQLAEVVKHMELGSQGLTHGQYARCFRGLVQENKVQESEYGRSLFV
jgi:hypothetical protein